MLNVPAFYLYVLGKHKACLSKRHCQFYILRSLWIACQVSSLVRHLRKFKLHFAVIYYAFEDLKEQMLQPPVRTTFTFPFILVIRIWLSDLILSDKLYELKILAGYELNHGLHLRVLDYLARCRCSVR